MSGVRALPLIIALTSLVAGCSLFTDLHGLSGGDGGGADTGDAGVKDGDSTSDAEAGVPATSIVLLQSADTTFSGASATIPLSPTKAGSLVVVGAAHNGQNTDEIVGIVDNAPPGSSTYASTKQRSTSDCSKATEIWAASNVNPGATSLTVTTTGGGNFYVWVAEFAGLGSAGRPSAGNAASNQPATLEVTAPSVVTTAPSIVVSVAISCSTLGGLRAGSSFTALAAQQRGAFAYLLAPEAGTFGAEWDTPSANGWNATTVAFSAAP
jgi:hypothetical protein